MEPFYIELKNRRERQSIDLAEIQNRTKINLSFLEAIENGEFDILPITYIRLFLRAYVTEIGGDPQEALMHLEQHLGALEGKITQKPAIEEDTQTERLRPRKSILSQSPLKLRSNIIKGGILLIIWIFALIIIRKVTIESSGVVSNGSAIYTMNGVNFITEEKLLSDYVEFSSRDMVLDVTPPLAIKIVCTRKVGYQVTNDSSAVQRVSMVAGDNQSYTFTDRFDILFNHTEGVSVFINGESVPAIESYPTPMRVSFTAEPVIVTVRRYIPIN